MATAYANACGTGNRTSLVLVRASAATGTAVSDWVEGNLANTTTYFAGGLTNFILEFWFPSRKIIDEAKFYQSNASSHGTFKWQGSQDRATWTDVGSTFTLGGVATQTITTLAGNTTAYLFYRLFQTGGTTSSSPYIHEFEFKIDEGSIATSYLNALGSGNRTATITATSSGITWVGMAITALLNGGRVIAAGEGGWDADATNAGDWIQFDLGAAYVVQQARWWASQVNAQGTWKLQRSPDSTTWTDLSAAVTLSGTTAVGPVVTCFGGGESNLTAYRYYRILGVSGSRTTLPYQLEVEFLVAATPGDLPGGGPAAVATAEAYVWGPL